MKTWLLIFALGVCSALPVDLELENPEEAGFFEGDIELEPGEDPTHKNVVGDKRRTWPNAVIPYSIQSSYTAAEQTNIKAAMNEIEERTKVNGKTCIHFQPHAHETAYMYFGSGTGCHTPIGYSNKQIKVTLGHGCLRKGTIMHEIMHGLGFYHEQSRHDRDQYVIIHLDNVQAGHEGNFKKYAVPYIDELHQPYDYGSVMHYGMYSFAKDKSKPTIEPTHTGVTIGQRVRLSDIDIKEMQILYGCIPEPSSNGGGFVTAPPATTSAPPAGSDVCTFEHDTCTWTQETGDSMNWIRHKGATSTSRTGPINDPHGNENGYYLYLEADGHSGDVAKIDSKAYPGGDYCVDFYYHMYGATEGTLYLNSVSSSGHVHRMKTWTGDHQNRWHHYRIHFTMHTTHTFKFQFEGHVGTGTTSDIAIDDVIVHPGRC